MYGVPIIIGIVNFASKSILRFLTTLNKSQEIPSLRYHQAINTMLISFLNIGVIVLLVNISIKQTLPIPILQGRYDEFSVEWYRLVGSNINVQIIILILSSNATNLIMQMVAWCKLCKDRGFSCDNRNTKQLSQYDYEAVHTGPDPGMDIKYASMLTVIYVVMLYGSGIPILYLIAAFYFLVTYWVDKQLVLNHYRKAEMYDENLAIQTLSWYKYAILLHLIGGILMYSNANILPVAAEDLKTQFNE